MSLTHDELSAQCQREIIKNWKKGTWNNSPISKQVYLTQSYSDWPKPDGAMYDPKNKLFIGIEFKPHTENKRGIQTGIGQSLTYLDRFSASYLIIPKTVEDYPIAEYLKKLFKKEIKGKVPTGLFSYDIDNSMQIELLVDIFKDIDFDTKAAPRGAGRYWAKFIDTNPHIVFLALDLANSYNKETINRKESIWKEFFDKYYFPIEHRKTLVPFDSIIDHWGERKMEPFRDKIKQLNKLIDMNEMTREDAIKELEQHCSNEGRPSLSRSTQSDNLYKSYRKNYFTFLNHLQLWDINAHLTPLGKKLYNIGKKFGYNSDKYFYMFAKIILIQGKHYDLIQDIKKYSHGLDFDTSLEIRKHVFTKMEEDGLIKRNKARAVTKNSTKLFSMQFQAWSKLGIIPSRSDERYIPGYGFNFNDKVIEKIMNSPDSY